MGYGKILSVEAGSLAEELELVPGDKIVEVNGMKLRDIIDLSFAFADEEIELLIEHEDGEQELLEFDKDYDEELGAWVARTGQVLPCGSYEVVEKAPPAGFRAAGTTRLAFQVRGDGQVAELYRGDGMLVVKDGWSPEHGPREDGVAHDQQIVRELLKHLQFAP